MKKIILLLLGLLTLSFCSKKRYSNTEVFITADSLYWNFFETRKAENLFEADSILRNASATNIDNNIRYSKLARINFILGRNNVAEDYLNTIDDSFFGDNYRKQTYSLALEAFSSYFDGDTNTAKQSLLEAIKTIDNHLESQPDDSIAISIKYILRRQIYDEDIEVINEEIKQLPYQYLIDDINAYPPKMHYRFYSSSYDSFWVFLLEEL